MVATGPSRKNAGVAVSTGLRQSPTREQAVFDIVCDIVCDSLHAGDLPKNVVMAGSHGHPAWKALLPSHPPITQRIDALARRAAA